MLGPEVRQVNEGRRIVMSSRLCKKVEGAGFPFQVESLEDGVDDGVHAFEVDKAHHGSGSASHLDEAALDHIAGAQFAPQVPGESEERQQLQQVSAQPLHHAGNRHWRGTRTCRWEWSVPSRFWFIRIAIWPTGRFLMCGHCELQVDAPKVSTRLQT